MEKKIIVRSLMEIVYNGGIRENNTVVFGSEVLEVLTVLGKVDPQFREEEGILVVSLARGKEELVVSYDMNNGTWSSFFTEYDSEDLFSQVPVKEISIAYMDSNIQDHDQWFADEQLVVLTEMLFPAIRPMLTV